MNRESIEENMDALSGNYAGCDVNVTFADKENSCPVDVTIAHLIQSFTSTPFSEKN